MTPEDKKEPDTRRESRIISGENIEMRIEGEGDEKRLVGYAAKFNKWSVDLGIWEKFREKIAPGAFKEAIKNSDTRALKNHDPNLILGRTESDTLRLVENKTGLKFEIDIPNTTTGADTLEEIRRGDITGCSFAFTVESDTWDYKDDGTIERTINKVGELFDVGPVTYPAYPDTTVAARSLDAFKDSIDKEKRDAEEKQKQKEEENQQKEMDFDTRHRIECDYRRAERILNRNRPSND
jgi:HK97 family phage prohead protease